MAGPDSQQLHRLLDRFPEPPAGSRLSDVDDRVSDTYRQIAGDWYADLRGLVDAYAEGEVRRERVLTHVESIPSVRLSDGAAPLPERQAALLAAADEHPEIADLSAWYADLRDLLTDDPDELTLFERALHDFGYVVAHGLFLGASSPETVVRRLRLAYRLVGVRIDDTHSDGAERTTFTCPYRNLGAGRCGTRWVCHEKLDRVDDGYVTYLAERGIDYQRPRGCSRSPQCYSTVARESPERWWPKTPPEAVRHGRTSDTRHRRRIRESYQRWARLYDWGARATTGVGGVRAGCVDALDLDPGDTVVEFGCGPGPNLAALRDEVGPSGHVVGVDLTPRMLDRAQALVARRGWENVSLVQADATTPPIAAADAILATFVTSLFPDPYAVVSQWCDIADSVVVASFAPRGSRTANAALWGLTQVNTGLFDAAGANALDQLNERTAASRRALDDCLDVVEAGSYLFGTITVSAGHREA